MKKSLPLFFLLPALIPILVITVYPMIYSIYMGFHRLKLTGARSIEFVGLTNYIELIYDPSFSNSVQLIVTFVVLAVSIELLLGLVMATIVNSKIRGASLVRIIITIPIVLTPITVGVFWKMILQPEVGWLNQFLDIFGLPAQNWLGDPSTALYATVLMDAWEWTPFIALILMASMQAIPDEIFEAARSYGASDLQVFRYMTLPLIKRGIFIAVLLRSIDAVKIFDQIFVLTRGGPALSTDYLTFFIWRVGLKFFNIGYACAASWLYLLSVSVIVLVFIKGLKIKV